MDFLRCFCGGFCLLRSCISRRCFNTLCFSGGLCCSLAVAVGFLGEDGEILHEKVISAACGVSILENQTDKTYQKGQEGSLALACNGVVDEFQYLEIDGEEVPEAHYTVESGSTILSLTPEYMDTLSVGTHTAELFYTVGSARWEFTVTEEAVAEDGRGQTGSEAKKTDVGAVKTGDESSPLLWTGILLLGLGGIAIMGQRLGRSRKL